MALDMTKPQRESFYSTCKEAYELVEKFQSNQQPWGPVPPEKKGYHFDPEIRKTVQKKVNESLAVLEKLLDHHQFLEIAILYNGGKDCLVMLLLVLSSVYKKYYQTSPPKLPTDQKFDAVYINAEIPFPKLSEFIKTSALRYHLRFVELQDSLQNGFGKYLDQNPNIKAIIVGIRHSDPYGSTLQLEQMTDGDWPRFLRIHPILNWNYVDIWDFLIGCNVDYCSMYNQGYTSLGGVHNTIPNPFLKHKDSYLPAYMLRDNADERERLGRLKGSIE